ncbi:hypothetical protein [Streptosporangium sp. NPDC087985]|uniref:hypothetical protein n=1 Tax=Streptosporangium sp. NPDC087985 TaxID=3366196 RepID=UPI0037F707F2
MTLATEVKKLADSKPFYAAAGVGDLAAEKLRELPEQIHRLQGHREEIREAAKSLPEKARGYAKNLPEKARGYAKDLPEKARGYADQFTGRAVKLYEEFASRGRKAVSKASSEAALELEEVSETAEPTRKNSRAPKRTSTRKS